MSVTIFKSDSIYSDNKIVSELAPYLFNGQGYLITPTKGGAITIQKELLKKAPLIGNRVLSIHELIKRLATPHKPILPREISLLLLFEIMKRGVYKSPTIMGISPVLDIINFANRNLLHPKQSNDHLNQIFFEYNKCLSSSSFTDDSTLTNLCLENIKNRRVKLPEKIGFIGFPKLSNAEIEIIKHINKCHLDTEITISHPYLPNETIMLDAKTVEISDTQNKCNMEVIALPSASSELRFLARSLINKETLTIITRKGQEGSSSFTTMLCEEGVSPLLNRNATHSGIGFINNLVNKLPENTLKIDDWCDNFINLAEEEIKNREIYNSGFFETLEKIKAWSNIILKETFPKNIFIELLEMFEKSSISLNALNSAYPFNWSLFEDGIYPKETAIICKMTANNYPKFKKTSHPLIKGWWKDILEENEIIKDECLFQRLLQSVENLTITYSSTNSNGSESHKSPFLENIICSEKNVSILPLIPNSIDYDKRLALEKQRASNSEPEIFRGYIKSKKCLEMIRKEKNSPPTFNVTELEKYAKCPFEYFIKYILRAKELKETDLALIPMDRGNFAHKLLSLVLTNDSIKMNDNELTEHIDKILIKIENDLPDYFNKSLWNWEKKNLFKWAINAVHNAKENSKLPIGPNKFITEWSFGDDKTQPFELKIQSGEKIHLKGRVDRIDISSSNSCFSVVDYKTSASANVTKSELNDGTHLQLPLYMEAVKTLLLKNSTPAGAFIYSLGSNNLSLILGKKNFNDSFYYSTKRCQFDDESFENIQQNIIEKTKEYIQDIFNGNFGFDNVKCERNCRLKTICKNKKDYY